MRMAAIGIVAGGLAWTTWANGPAPRQEHGQDFQWHGHLAAGRTATNRNIHGGVRAEPPPGGDGQVTVGETVMKSHAQKVRLLKGGKVVAGFAGGAADARLPRRGSGGASSPTSSCGTSTTRSSSSMGDSPRRTCDSSRDGELH